MQPVSAVSANLAIAAIQGVLYGIFVVLAIAALTLLIRRHSQSLGHAGMIAVDFRSLFASPMFVTTICLLLAATTHWILSIVCMFQAFITSDSGAFPNTYYENLRRPLYIAQICLEIFCIVIGDVLLLYRLWVVWAYRRYVIILPVCTLLGLIASGAGVGRSVSEHRDENGFPGWVTSWVTSAVVFALCTNIYSTILIAWRVWQSHIATKRYSGGQKLMNVLAVFAESALLLATWTIFFAITFELRSSLAFVAQGGIPSVTGIASTLITVRVGLGLGLPEQQAHPQPIELSASLASSIRSRVRPLQVHVTHVVHQTEDFDVKSSGSTKDGAPGGVALPE